ncbi:hypothetical protein ACFQ58_10935 [Agromyces sp. NPDC056523]|uniref:hypothetical protein n=1 Tax=Agromyces sp. NPDC056523 TaxID=3345850 RepID=UPI0036711670
MAKLGWRSNAIRVIGWVTGGFLLVLFFGLVDLTVPLTMQARPEFYAGYLIETGWGVLFTFFAGLPFCFLGARPDWSSAALLTGAAGTAVLVAGIASGQPLQLLVVVGLLVPTAAVLVLSPLRTDSGGDSGLAGPLREPAHLASRVAYLAMSLVALPPTIVYATDMIGTAIEGVAPVHETYVFDHYPIQAAFALAIPLATALLALRLPGWRPMTILVGLGTAWFAVVGIVYPDHLGSWGTTWGWIGLAWAVVLSSLTIRFGRGRRRAEAARGEASDEQVARS